MSLTMGRRAVPRDAEGRTYSRILGTINKPLLPLDNIMALPDWSCCARWSVKACVYEHLCGVKFFFWRELVECFE